MNKVLTIAGSDSSGGAGIQADLKTFQKFGVYGMTALTVIVAMDPHDSWKHQVFPLDIEVIKAQLETSIVGVGVDALKTGMLPTTEIIELVAYTIKRHNLTGVVVDPVMVCKGAGEPLNPENTECYKKTLVPLATVVTPNLFEAAQLSGIKTISTVEQMKEAAKEIKQLGAEYVVVKGGKGVEHKNAVDVVYDGKTFSILESTRIDTLNTHGAGCTFSAAIAAQIAQGVAVQDAIPAAKRFITQAIERAFKLNQYVGVLNHSSCN